MKRLFLCILFYGVLVLIVASTVVMPGNIQKSQPAFPYISFSMMVLGIVWVIRSTFFILITPWYAYVWMHRKKYFARRNYRPLVSAIIPAYNEEVGLVATVKTILASSYRPLEVVVVNDGSTDRSDEIMRAFVQKYELYVRGSRNYVPIVYHYQPNEGKAYALNTGISLSYGEIIVTFDADSVVHQHVIEHFVAYFCDPEVMAVAGNIRLGNTRTILGLIQDLEYGMGFQKKKAEALLGIVFVIGGAASAFRRDVFHKLGGYTAGTLTEDLDLTLRIQEAGMRIVYAPEAIVHTEGPATLRSLLKQRLRWKRGRFEAFRMHRATFFNRKKGSNKWFFWLILPLVIVDDIEIVLGSAYLLLLYIYSFLSHDFLLLLFTIAMAALTFLFQLIDDKNYRKFSYFVFIPLMWFIFHLVTFIELYSLFNALYTLLFNKEVKWQKWQRNGVVDS